MGEETSPLGSPKDSASNAAGRDPPPSYNPPAMGERILIVDDEAGIRSSLASIERLMIMVPGDGDRSPV